LEPAAVLVGRFEVKVGWVLQFRAAAEDGLMAHAGIDPDVEGVVSFGRAGGESEHGGEFRVGHFEPRIGAAFFHEVGHAADEVAVKDGLSVRCVKNRQRHAPAALAADAPVGPGLDRAVDAFESPVGDPLRGVDRFEGVSAEGLDTDEELLDRAKDDRRFRAPAVRVGVLVGRDAE